MCQVNGWAIHQNNTAVTSSRATLMPSSVVIGLGESPLWAATHQRRTACSGSEQEESGCDQPVLWDFVSPLPVFSCVGEPPIFLGFWTRTHNRWHSVLKLLKSVATSVIHSLPLSYNFASILKNFLRIPVALFYMLWAFCNTFRY